MGTWNSAPADARTHFALLGSTELRAEQYRRGTGGLGGPHQRAGVAGIGDVDEHEGERARRGRRAGPPRA